MATIISVFAVIVAASVTQVGQVGQAVQPTFRIDMGNMRGVDAATVQKAFDDRVDVSKKCYADAATVKRLHHAIRGWILMTIDIRQDGTITTARIDDQAIGTRAESASDFVDCMQDKVLHKLAFPALDHVQGRTASVTFRVNP
jgi:hypothetical protein